VDSSPPHKGGPTHSVLPSCKGKSALIVHSCSEVISFLAKMRWYYGWFEVAQSLSGGLAIPRAKPPFFHFFYSWSSQTNPVSYGSGLTNPKGQTSLHYFLFFFFLFCPWGWPNYSRGTGVVWPLLMAKPP